jgi:hypothetical protein
MWINKNEYNQLFYMLNHLENTLFQLEHKSSHYAEITIFNKTRPMNEGVIVQDYLITSLRNMLLKTLKVMHEIESVSMETHEVKDPPTSLTTTTTDTLS